MHRTFYLKSEIKGWIVTIIKWLATMKKRETELYFSRKLIYVTGCFSVTCTVRVAEITEKNTKYIYSLKTFELLLWARLCSRLLEITRK